MISVDYVNNGGGATLCLEPFSIFERFMESCDNDMTMEYDEYRSKTGWIVLESYIMDEIKPSDDLFLESENKNLLGKIGETIIKIGKEFIKMIDSVIEKFKDMSFRTKNNEKRLAELIKEHPELGKEKIKILCDQGGLELGDMKSISQLDEEFEKILEMSKKAEIDPKSLRGRWDKAVKKFNGSSLFTTAKNVTVVLTCAVLIHEFRTKLVQANKNYTEAKSAANKLDSKIYETLKSYNDPNFTDSTGKAQCLLAMYREKKGLTEKALKRQASVINRMNNSIASFIDGVAGSKAGKAVLGDVTGSFHKDKKRMKVQREAEEFNRLKDVAREAKFKERGRKKA